MTRKTKLENRRPTQNLVMKSCFWDELLTNSRVNLISLREES